MPLGGLGAGQAGGNERNLPSSAATTYSNVTSSGDPQGAPVRNPALHAQEPYHNYQAFGANAAGIPPQDSAGNIFPYPPQQYDYDLFQGQQWLGPGQPGQSAASLTSGGAGGSQAGFGQSSPNLAGDSTAPQALGQGSEQSPAAQSSNPQLRRSHSISMPIATNPVSPLSTFQEQRRQSSIVNPSPPKNPPSTAGRGSSTAGQSRRTRAQKGTPLRQMFQGIPTQELVDQEAQRGQASPFPSRPSAFAGALKESQQDVDTRSEPAESSVSGTSPAMESGGLGSVPGILRTGQDSSMQPIPPRLIPPTKAFNLQIGSQLFTLAGASIMSDG